MQSGYGASEIQRFMVDGSVHGSAIFSISSAIPPNPSASSHTVTGGGGEVHHSTASATNSLNLINPFFHHHHHVHKPPPPPAPMEFPPFHSIPITHQLFTRPPHPHHHHHEFQLFHNNPASYDQHRRLPSTLPFEPDTENHGATMPSFLATANMNFKLAVDDSSGSGSKDGVNNDDNNIAGGILHGDDASESRLRLWQGEEDCAIKEPFWRPLDKRRKNEVAEGHHFAKRSREAAGNLDNSRPPEPGGNYKLFSELEAIYRPGNVASVSSGGAHAANQTTGSDSALTGDEHLVIPATDGVGRLDDNNSTVCENIKKIHQHSHRLRRRRKAQKEAIADFFEGLVKQLMDQQQLLHQRLIDTLDRRDAERSAAEQARLQEEAARAAREAAISSHERALAATRETAILSLLEKISGEILKLPTRPQQISIPSAAAVTNEAAVAAPMMKTNRWPKAEVQALIAVRSGLEGRFQETGLKGPLWEEVSASMSKLGFRRSAKRCKEKWENMNKYFRKAKYSGRNRSQHSKTCPYFQQLDQLYSNSLAPFPSLPPPNMRAAAVDSDGEQQGFTEEVGESEGSMQEVEEEQTNQPGLFNQYLQ